MFVLTLLPVGFMPAAKNIFLDIKFERLIDSFIEDKVGVTENFLGEALASHLRDNLNALYAEKKLQSAKIGNEDSLTQNLLIRNDKIFWLDPAHDDPHENSFFLLVDNFIAYLNRTCFAGITGYEFHYAMYEKGSFYKRHLDQFKHNGHRVFSMIMYLNEGWEAKDGGELRVFHPDSQQTISPINGKCVFFDSTKIEHEVLATNKPRLSVTGWLKR